MTFAVNGDESPNQNNSYFLQCQQPTTHSLFKSRPICWMYKMRMRLVFRVCSAVLPACQSCHWSLGWAGSGACGLALCGRDWGCSVLPVTVRRKQRSSSDTASQRCQDDTRASESQCLVFTVTGASALSTLTIKFSPAPAAAVRWHNTCEQLIFYQGEDWISASAQCIPRISTNISNPPLNCPLPPRTQTVWEGEVQLSDRARIVWLYAEIDAEIGIVTL